MSSTAKNSSVLSKRRRFQADQPTITSFFAAASNSPSSPIRLSNNHYSAVTHSLTPVVPDKIQSSLLSVGGRVRKSVAEGYKTHDKHTFLAKESAPALLSIITPTAHSELAPFCGVSKSGDYTSTSTTATARAVQSLPQPRNHIPTPRNQIITTDEDDAFSIPPSSQESTDSDGLTPDNYPTFTAQKRSYDSDDCEDDVDDYIGNSLNNTNGSTWQDPLRLNPVSSETTSTTTVGRTILSPRLNQQRRRFYSAQRQQMSTLSSATMDVDDFEEPSFLRRREEVDMDYEVQIGGV